MNKQISRRILLQGLGQSAALTSLAALPGLAGAAQSTAPQVLPPAGATPARKPAAPAPAKAPAAPPAPKTTYCMSMLYPAGEGLTFDADAFRDRHIPVLKTAYGAGLDRVELRVVPPPAPGVSAPPVLAAVNVWIKDVNKFVEGANSHAKEISASMATITASKPMAQFDKIVASFGEPREAVVPGSSCLSSVFLVKDVPEKGAATWDSRGYAENFLGKIFEAAGPGVIQRIEVLEGAQAVGGGKLLMLGTANVYIADEKKYVEAMGQDAVKAVAAEEAKYFNTPPFMATMQVKATS
jgi:hypothetical protein